MPTKVRRERELKRAEEKARQETLRKNILENIPDYIRQRIASGRKSMLPLCDNIPSYLNLKGGLLTWDGEGTPWLSPKANLNNNKRRHYREKDALELKLLYPAIWGKKGYAKVIAAKEELSIRTIQKYFKKFT